MSLATLFDGPHLEPADHARLGTALDRVKAYMRGGAWHTLREIAEACGCSEAGASARLRDLRKAQHGRHQVDARRQTPGTYEYRVWL